MHACSNILFPSLMSPGAMSEVTVALFLGIDSLTKQPHPFFFFVLPVFTFAVLHAILHLPAPRLRPAIMLRFATLALQTHTTLDPHLAPHFR